MPLQSFFHAHFRVVAIKSWLPKVLHILFHDILLLSGFIIVIWPASVKGTDLCKNRRSADRRHNELRILVFLFGLPALICVRNNVTDLGKPCLIGWFKEIIVNPDYNRRTLGFGYNHRLTSYGKYFLSPQKYTWSHIAQLQVFVLSKSLLGLFCFSNGTWWCTRFAQGMKSYDTP